MSYIFDVGRFFTLKRPLWNFHMPRNDHLWWRSPQRFFESDHLGISLSTSTHHKNRCGLGSKTVSKEILFANWAPPCRAVVEAISEWFLGSFGRWGADGQQKVPARSIVTFQKTLILQKMKGCLIEGTLFCKLYVPYVFVRNDAKASKRLCHADASATSTEDYRSYDFIVLRRNSSRSCWRKSIWRRMWWWPAK